MAKELKPCPFCGSDNIQFNTCWDEEAYIFCQCMNCRSTTKEFLEKKNAACQWNRRVDK